MNTECSTTAATEGKTQKPQRGWFRRNWLWFVPLALIIVGGGGFLGFLEIHAWQVRSSTGFQKALAKIVKDSGAQDATGGQFELVKWRLPDYFDSSTEQRINCELRGPKGKIAMHLLMRKNNNFIELKIDLPGGKTHVIDMSDGTNNAPTYTAKKSSGPVVEKGPGPEVDFNIPDGK